MSSETSEITSVNTAAGHNETELTLGLPGEPRCRKLTKKRRCSDTIGSKSINDEASDANQSDATKSPPDEEHVAGWPPVTVQMKNVVNSNFKFVKVVVDGAPYMRKVDLESYRDYQQLQRALVDIFFYFRRIKLNMNLVNRIKYVSTYEDKDGDWMLVGDVPWKMFVRTCKRIRLMRSSEIINAAPRTSSKCSVSSC